MHDFILILALLVPLVMLLAYVAVADAGSEDDDPVDLSGNER